MEKQTKKSQQITQYLKQRVMPILQPLQIDILINRPSDIYQYSLAWLQNYEQNEKKILQLIQDEDQPDEIFKERIKKKLEKNKGFRIGVSGQSLTKLCISDKSEHISFDKSQQTKIKLLIQLRSSILFRNLTHQNILQIISSMKQIEYKSGQIVIKEGDVGNQLFIVDQGSFKCFFSDRQDIKMYGPGQTFGQLSLLYGSRRSSTIVAETNGKLYSLGRKDFNRILRDCVMKKAKVCEEIINKVQIFSTMDRYEKSKLYQSLKQLDVGPGKYIIREGQLGDCFYIVAEGKLVAEKQQNGEIVSVYYYREGDYFGEIALIRNIPRQASVKTLTKVKLVYIERSAFKRILGPLEQILKRNQISRYKKIKHQVKNNLI